MTRKVNVTRLGSVYCWSGAYAVNSEWASGNVHGGGLSGNWLYRDGHVSSHKFNPQLIHRSGTSAYSWDFERKDFGMKRQITVLFFPLFFCSPPDPRRRQRILLRPFSWDSICWNANSSLRIFRRFSVISRMR